MSRIRWEQPWPSPMCRWWMRQRNAAIDDFRARRLPGVKLADHLEKEGLAVFRAKGGQ